MNTEIKKRWIEALTSGEYKQTSGALHRDGEFCCLGVLCDLHRKETNDNWLITQSNILKMAFRTKSYYGESGVLPEIVSEWAGLHSEDPITSIVNSKGDYSSLSTLNDKKGLTFAEIANIIDIDF